MDRVVCVVVVRWIVPFGNGVEVAESVLVW